MNERADILVVDDNPVNVRLLSQMLKARDYRVRTAGSGERALVAARSESPDLILLDVMMPDVSGQEVRAEIAKLPGCEAAETIYVTAKAEDDFTDKLRADGALDVITKPFDPMTLASEIRDIWQRARRGTGPVSVPDPG